MCKLYTTWTYTWNTNKCPVFFVKTKPGFLKNIMLLVDWPHLKTGVGDDKQCQAVYQQVYGAMNSVKRFCKQVYGPMNNVKRFVNRYTRWWTMSNGFVNRSTGRWTMSSSLLTGVRADEQCQAVCHQVYELMNSVKRFCQQVYGPLNNVKQFVNRCTGRWTMSSGLSSGVRVDEQCQTVLSTGLRAAEQCQAVC